jgi:HD-GYP domain-containing protein (c-di-GMP phosphodiesterase class II)
MEIMKTRDKVEILIKNLAGAMHISDMYGEKHKMARESIEGLYSVIRDILKNGKRITIGIIGGEVAYEKQPFYETSKRVKGFIDRLRKLTIEKLTFLDGVEEKELEAFVALLSLRSSKEDVKKCVEADAFAHIKIGKIGVSEEEDEDRSPDKDVNVMVEEAYRDGTDILNDTADRLRDNKPIDLSSARQFMSGIVGALLKNKDILRVLTSTRSHDESTFVHQVNVAIFTMLQAEALGMEEADLNDIGIASLLHDAGKLAITGDVIRKKEELTKEDKVAITSHPLNGAKILLETPGIGVLAAIAAFEHHIRYDLSGYPRKLYGSSVNFITMLTTIADYYDALRSERSYHEGAAPEKVYADMKELSGKFFHPDLLENFFRVIGVYPPGTLVELDTKEIGMVLRVSPADIKRPQVEVLYNSDGEKIEVSYLADLAEKDGSGNYIKSINRSIAPSDKY